MMTDIGLAEMIAAMRQELAEAQAEGEGKDLRFNVKNIELEVQFTVTKSADAEGGISFKVFSVGADVGGGAAYEKASVQRVKIQLDLTDKDGTSPRNIPLSG